MKIGRPKRITLNADEVIKVIISEIFEKHLLKDKQGHPTILGDHNKNDLARTISELAIPYGVILNCKEIASRLFKPFIESGEFQISRQYMIRIITFLNAAADEFEYTDQLSLVNELAAIVAEQGNLLAHTVKMGPNEYVSHVIALTNWLNGTSWYLYERIGDEDGKEASWGIAIGKLLIKELDGQLISNFEFIHQKAHKKYEGTVTSDELFRYLYIDLILDNFDKKKGTITLVIAESDRYDQNIMLGHFTYHSKTYGRLLTNAIIIEKTGVDQTVVELGNYLSTDEEYTKINASIKKFLYSRTKNRLSLPKKPLTNLLELEAFIGNRKKIFDPELNHFLGGYYVYYQSGEGCIIEDELVIQEKPSFEYIEGVYSHRPDYSGKNKKNWTGRVFINRETVVLNLSELRNVKRKQEEDTILLAFLKPGEQITYDDCECFPGLLSGLQDSTRLPVSFICLIVRQTTPDFERAADMRILNYFKSQGEVRLTPPDIGYKLEKYKGRSDS